MNDEPQNALEALLPMEPCDEGELLRFLNFTDALGKWWAIRKRWLAEINPTRAAKQGYWLYHQTVDVQLRIYRYEPVKRKGSHYHLDREFLALFPQELPMGDGSTLSWGNLLKYLKQAKESCSAAANAPKLKP